MTGQQQHQEQPAQRNASPRDTLARLVGRFRLSKATLRLIAQADNPTLGDSGTPDEATIAKVNSAIEVLVLAGLDSDQLIAGAITQAQALDEPGVDWRQQLWSDVLAAADKEYERRGRPEHPLGPPLQALPPIPPQPASEIDRPAPLAA